METKTSLRKHKKAYLLDMLREAYPFKSERWYLLWSKEEIIDKLLESEE